MTIRKIADPAFTMHVEDPKLAAILERLNKKKDDTIDLSDFDFPVSGVSTETKIELMRDLVVGAFQEAGYIQNDTQKEATRKFFKIAERVNRFFANVEKVIHWGDAVSSMEHGLMLLLDISYCQFDEFPYSFQETDVNNLTNNLFSILLMAGEDGKKDPEEWTQVTWKGQSCGSGKTGFDYNESALPPPLRPVVRDVAQRYLNGVALLYEYDAMACGEEDNPDNISCLRELGDMSRLDVIRASTTNEIHIKNF